jgi:hypothetical protein
VIETSSATASQTQVGAPALSIALLSGLFLCTSSNLKLLVSSQVMVFVSMIGVVAVPALGLAMA